MENSSSNGFWGPVTSNIDWCESNYEISYYIAEFYNTISNVALVAPFIVGAIEGWRGRPVEFHYILPFIALIGVGVGSFLFHMSLLYHLQMFDEMPMIWGTATIVYAVTMLDKPFKHHNYWLAALLLFLCAVSTTTYVLLDDRMIFEGSYTCMVIYSIAMLFKYARKHDRGALGFFAMAFFLYGTGVAFWLVDRFHCDKLQAIRSVLHPGMHGLSQFHALWHFFVGMGSHAFLLLIFRVRLSALKKPHLLGFHLGILPYYASPKSNHHPHHH